MLFLEMQVTDTKLYVPVKNLSTQDNAKLLEQLKSTFKGRIDWNKYQSKVLTERESQYLHFLIDPILQGVNRFFVLSIENGNDKVEIKDYIVMIEEKNFFDQPVKSDMRIFDSIRKLHQVKEMITQNGCLLNCNYFNKNYKMILIYLSEQQGLDADRKAIQKINFTRNLDRAEGATMFLIIEDAKETILDFSQGNVKVLWMCSTILFCFNIILT